MEERFREMTHYFKGKKQNIGRKTLIPFTFRGLTLEFYSYSSLFSGTKVDLGTRLLLEEIELPREGRILDIGCGYGVIGITIAKLNPKLIVYMTDVNPLAVKITKYNAKINDVLDRVVILQGNLYEPVKNMRFNGIYSNPPLSAGMDIVKEIVLNAKKYLTNNGIAQFVLARGGEYLFREASKVYRDVKIIRRKGYIILKLTP